MHIYIYISYYIHILYIYPPYSPSTTLCPAPPVRPPSACASPPDPHGLPGRRPGGRPPGRSPGSGGKNGWEGI